MIRLFDREFSGNSYKVRLLLALLALAYERVPVLMKDGKNLVDDEYLRLNPRGLIPTLQDENVTLWGSTAILCYLATRYDDSGAWLPREPAAFAQVMQWLELAQNEVQSGLSLARAITRFGKAGDLQAARQQGKVALNVLESRLATKAWLAGNASTIADVACFPYAALAPEGGVDLAPYPGVRRWLSNVKQLDRFTGMPGI